MQVRACEDHKGGTWSSQGDWNNINLCWRFAHDTLQRPCD